VLTRGFGQGRCLFTTLSLLDDKSDALFLRCDMSYKCGCEGCKKLRVYPDKCKEEWKSFELALCFLIGVFTFICTLL
jgi:hypothetical protein